MAIMLTGPRRSIFARSAAMASSALMDVGAGPGSGIRDPGSGGSRSSSCSSAVIEAADLGANRLEQLAGLPDGRILRVHGRAESAGGLVRQAQLLAHRLERLDLVVERPLGDADRLQQLLAASLHLRALDRTRGDPLLELARGFAQACGLAGQPRGALEQSRVRGARRPGPVVQLAGRFLRRRQAALRVRETSVGRALRVLEPRDRLLALGGPRVEREALLLRLAPF